MFSFTDYTLHDAVYTATYSGFDGREDETGFHTAGLIGKMSSTIDPIGHDQRDELFRPERDVIFAPFLENFRCATYT